MSYEKSCGAVLWRNTNGTREYLLILNKKGDALGHWGFPKGHVEAGETERETAQREILEEVGIRVGEFLDGFRAVNHYSPRPGVEKDAVYFMAEVEPGTVHIQQSEVADFKWQSFADAKKTITHDLLILQEAESFLSEKGIS